MADEDDLHLYISDFDVDDPNIEIRPNPEAKKLYLKEKIDPSLSDSVVDYWDDDTGRWIKIRNPKTGSVFKLMRSEQVIDQRWLDILEAPPKHLFKELEYLNMLSQIKINGQSYLPNEMLEGLKKINSSYRRAKMEVENRKNEDVEKLFLKSKFNVS